MLASTLTIGGCSDGADAGTPTRSKDSLVFVPTQDKTMRLRRPPRYRLLDRFYRRSSSICWMSVGWLLPLFVCMAMLSDDSLRRSSAKAKSNFIG